MKNLLVVGLCAAFTTSAFAAQLGIQFAPADPNTVNGQNATVVRGDTVTVQITWTQSVSETEIGLSAASFFFTTVPENPAPGLQGEMVEDRDITLIDAAAALPDWVMAVTGGGIGGFAWVSPFATLFDDTLRAPGTTVIGTFVIEVADNAALGLHPFYILRNPTFLSPTVVDGYDTAYTYSSPPTALGTYDIGSGFAGSNIDVMRSDDSIPLMINVVPEPATFTLLAMGGFAALRRRFVTR